MAYARPLAETTSFVNVQTARPTLYTVRADLHNRRVTTSWGPLGKLGRSISHTFPTREEAREFVETIFERRRVRGYVQL